jgi:flagellar motility protein MotE (MotC chaperone)
MAGKQKKAEKTPEPVKNVQPEKPIGFMHSVLVVLIALLVVALVSFGVFYFFTKNNIYGFAYTVKPLIENHPLLKRVLPEELLGHDPDDPKYLTEKEILKKYEEYREKVKSLNESLEKANQEIERMKHEDLTAQDTEAMLKENQAVLESIKQEQEALEAEKKALSEMIANGYREGFREYFEKVDKATAEAIYKEIVKDTLINEELAKLAKPFAEMEPKRAAQVLAELFASDRKMALDIMEGLKSGAQARILENMDARTAADIMSRLAERKTGQ